MTVIKKFKEKDRYDMREKLTNFCWEVHHCQTLVDKGSENTQITSILLLQRQSEFCARTCVRVYTDLTLSVRVSLYGMPML